MTKSKMSEISPYDDHNNDNYNGQDRCRINNKFSGIDHRHFRQDRQIIILNRIIEEIYLIKMVDKSRHMLY